MDNEYSCQECDAEFTIEHSGIDSVMFCPFCSARLNLDADDLDDSIWDDDHGD
jgi:DNA-directed RNA polymerase subunit RPC12/RpoP